MDFVGNANLWKMQFCGKCNSVENAIPWKSKSVKNHFSGSLGQKINLDRGQGFKSDQRDSSLSMDQRIN